VELRSGGAQLVQLGVPGFYDVRVPDEDGRIGRTLAVNPELREADPARLDPEDLIAAVAPAPGEAVASDGGGEGQNLLTEGPGQVSLAQEAERRQGAWRFMLLAAAFLLLGETYLAAKAKPLAKLAEEA
jgi:hypothetical protein